MRFYAKDNVDLVRCNQDGYWNAVSSDKFSDQTAFKICKVVLKDMTVSIYLVDEWTNAFPITSTVFD